jgi:hypothetical protein
MKLAILHWAHNLKVNTVQFTGKEIPNFLPMAWAQVVY